MKKTVDAMGQACPIPVVQALRALREMSQPGTLEVLVDNETAVENLKRMAAGQGLTAQTEKNGERAYTVTMEVSSPASDRVIEEPEIVCTPAARGSFSVAVTSPVMGQGDDALGRLLMKGFLYAVSQLPQPPQAMVFYNGGVHWAIEGSEALEDLKNLEAQGTRILVCGTCLNHYGLTEQLAVGRVSNMYEIVETLSSAGSVVRP